MPVKVMNDDQGNNDCQKASGQFSSSFLSKLYVFFYSVIVLFWFSQHMETQHTTNILKGIVLLPNRKIKDHIY